MSNYENMYHDDPDSEFDVPEVFREFIERGNLFPAYHGQWLEEDAMMHLPRKVFDVTTEVLMDVKATLDTEEYAMVNRMPLPSGQQSYIIREKDLFKLMREIAARVYMISTQPSDDDELPF